MTKHLPVALVALAMAHALARPSWEAVAILAIAGALFWGGSASRKAHDEALHLLEKHLNARVVALNERVAALEGRVPADNAGLLGSLHQRVRQAEEALEQHAIAIKRREPGKGLL